LFPPRITGPTAGPFTLPGIHKRLGSIALFYAALGVCGALLVLVYYAAASLNRLGPTETPLTGPVLYLLIAWGVVTAVFLSLLLWRSLLVSHEDDQIFLDATEEHMALEQRELVEKINTLSRPLLTSGIASAVLLLVIVGVWLYNGLKNF
jgi:hypothetical protein